MLGNEPSCRMLFIINAIYHMRPYYQTRENPKVDYEGSSASYVARVNQISQMFS